MGRGKVIPAFCWLIESYTLLADEACQPQFCEMWLRFLNLIHFLDLLIVIALIKQLQANIVT